MCVCVCVAAFVSVFMFVCVCVCVSVCLPPPFSPSLSLTPSLSLSVPSLGRHRHGWKHTPVNRVKRRRGNLDKHRVGPWLRLFKGFRQLKVVCGVPTLCQNQALHRFSFVWGGGSFESHRRRPAMLETTRSKTKNDASTHLLLASSLIHTSSFTPHLIPTRIVMRTLGSKKKTNKRELVQIGLGQIFGQALVQIDFCPNWSFGLAQVGFGQIG